MKRWRREAAKAKLQHIAAGKHEPGMRYGRIIKAMGLFKMDALPSTLFINMARRAGYLPQLG